MLNHCNFRAKPQRAVFSQEVGEGRGGRKGREKRREPTAADLNVALIKMVYTQAEEEQRNVFFLSFSSHFHLWVVFFLSPPCISLSSLLFYVSNFLSSSLFSLHVPAVRPSVCVKVTTGEVWGGKQAVKWKI